MSNWNLKLDQVASIEMCVAEFEIYDFEKIPQGKFKVKIFETQEGKYSGRTNLTVIDRVGYFCAGGGRGSTIEEALKDTIAYFYSAIDDVENLSESSFGYVDMDEF